MRRGRGDSSLDDAVNMDVMMDNMTDVVGTLLMVLIIVQLQVNNTINNIQSSLPQVTAKEAQEARQRSEEMRQALETKQQEIASATPASEELKQQVEQKRTDLNRFEAVSQDNDEALMALEKVRLELEAKRKELDAEKAAVTALLDERDRLKALLDDTPVPETEPAKTVRIPRAVEVPPGSRYVHVLCTRGGVYGCDFEALDGLVMKSFGPASPKLLREITKDPEGKEVAVFDHEKTIEFLNGKELGNKQFELKFPMIKTMDAVRLEAYPKQDGAEDPSKPGTNYTKILSQVKRAGNAVVWFHVLPDAFDTYLEARAMCDRIGAPAGWEMFTMPMFLKDIPGIRLNRLEEPPPPPPPPPPGEPVDVVIPPPKQRLD